MADHQQGLVMRSTGSFYDVLTADGQTHVCKTRGKLRLEGYRETNPVAVGDRVMFEPGGNVGVITEILPRDNHILRQSVKKASHAHVLAANVDQAMVVATLAFPRTSLGFIDRFLVSAESFRIPQVIVFNKRDLLDAESIELQEMLMEEYRKIGVTCFSISAPEEELGELMEVLRGKVTLVAGHSGVGKSTILNKLSPDINQKVGEVSEFTSKGMHTTTFAEMFRIDPTTFVIDTPGIKEWGLIDMTEQEVSDYFPEMRERRLDCKYGSRCLHVNEPGCAIVRAVEERQIALTRYESYLSILSGQDNRK